MGGVHLSGLLRRSGGPRASNHDLRVSPCPAPPSPLMLGQVAGEVKFEASCVLGSDRPAMNGDCTYLLGDPGKWFPYSFFICNVGVVTSPPPHQVTAVYITGDPSTDGAHWRQQTWRLRRSLVGGGGGKPSQTLHYSYPPSPCLMWPQVPAEGGQNFTNPRKRTIWPEPVLAGTSCQ